VEKKIINYMGISLSIDFEYEAPEPENGVTESVSICSVWVTDYADIYPFISKVVERKIETQIKEERDNARGY
jgi:hypothetical protein